MAGIGALGACLVETRPTDTLLVMSCVAVVFSMRLWLRRQVLNSIAAFLAGAMLLTLPYAVLYLSIYGMRPTPYMRLSAGIGFDDAALWWKSYLLLIDPRPWFPNGAGLLQRFPWIAAGLAGILATPFLRSERRPPLLLLSLLILTTWTSFFAYNDLQPGGLWLFENVHYFKWMFPGLLLLGFVVLRNLVGPHRLTAVCSCVLVVLATAIRLQPKQAGDHAAWMIQVAQTSPPFFTTYFGSLALKSSTKTLVNTRDFRALPDAEGFRMVLFHSGVTGDLSLVSRVPGIQTRDELSAIRWRISPRFGFPCWLPPYGCDGALQVTPSATRALQWPSRPRSGD